MSDQPPKQISLRPAEELPPNSLECLVPGRLLNGDTISAYLRLIERRSRMTPNLPSVWATDSFFYPSFARRGFAGIRRAIGDVDPLVVDLILIPIHDPNVGKTGHWFLVVVEPMKNQISVYDSIKKRNHRSILFIVKEFMDIISERAKKPPKSWKLWGERSCQPQANALDCGVYVCAYAEALTLGADIKDLAVQANEFRRQISKELSDRQMLTQRNIRTPTHLPTVSSGQDDKEEANWSFEDLMREVSILTQPVENLLSPIRSPQCDEDEMDAIINDAASAWELNDVGPSQSQPEDALPGPSGLLECDAVEEKCAEKSATSPVLSLTASWSPISESSFDVITDPEDMEVKSPEEESKAATKANPGSEPLAATTLRLSVADESVSFKKIDRKEALSLSKTLSKRLKTRRSKRRTMKVLLPGTNEMKRINVRKLGLTSSGTPRNT